MQMHVVKGMMNVRESTNAHKYTLGMETAPDLQYKHSVTVCQWFLDEVEKGRERKRREKEKKRENHQSWLWHDSAVQGVVLHMLRAKQAPWALWRCLFTGKFSLLWR